MMGKLSWVAVLSLAPRAAFTQPDAKFAHARLAAILARGEFVHVHDPSLWSLFWNAVLGWLWRSFGRVAGLSGRSEWVGRVFWGTVVAAGVAALLWWLQRQWRRGEIAAREPAPAAERTARVWEGGAVQASALAEQGDWRGAIHALYWAAVARFEAQGRWRGDRARTPREYLRLLPADNAAAREFALLTGSLERFWYGHRPAREADFQAARTWFAKVDGR